MRESQTNLANMAMRVFVALVLGIGLMLPVMPRAAQASQVKAQASMSVKVGRSDSYCLFTDNEKIHSRRWTIDGNDAFCVNPGYGGPDAGTHVARAVKESDFKSKKVYRAFVGALYYSVGGPGAGKGKKLMPEKDYKGAKMSADAIYANQHALLAYYFNGCDWEDTWRSGDPGHNFESPGSAYKSWFYSEMKPGSGDGWSTAGTWGSKVIALTNDEDMKANGGYSFKDFAEKLELVAASEHNDYRFQGIISWSFEPPSRGGVRLEKSSANTSITASNSCYSLAGATFGVYFDGACTKSVGVLTTDAAGKSNTLADLEEGVYFVKETKAPAGYRLDASVRKVKVKGGETSTVDFEDEPLLDSGAIRVTKVDDATGDARSQGAATLQGAEFTFCFYEGHYTEANLPAKPTRTWVMKTDADGVAAPFCGDAFKVSGDEFYVDGNGRVGIPLGTVTCVETKAPEGYLLGYRDEGGVFHDPKLYVSQIVADGTAASCQVRPINYGESEMLANRNTPKVPDSPARGNLRGVKVDADSGDGKALGAASLAGAKIAVINRSANVVVSPEDGVTEIGPGGTVCILATDDKGVFDTAASSVNGWSIPVEFGGCALPYGAYELREVAPPEGYVLDAEWSQVVKVSSQDQVVDVELGDSVVRGDLDVYKIAGKSQHPLANVPFVVESKTTGERHVLLTDSNGFFSTLAAFRSHVAKVNANDAAVSVRKASSGGSGGDVPDSDGKYEVDESSLVRDAGCWFSGRAGAGGAVPDDAVGALPYDTYVIDEVRCKANENYKLIEGYEITVSVNGWKIGPVTIEDDETHPRIATTLTDAEGTHSVPAGGECLLTDAVSYIDFEPGSYTFKGSLRVVAEDDSDLGVIATAEKQVEVEFPQGAVDMGFVVDAAEHVGKGRRLVATEQVFNAKGKLVAEHVNLSDEGQTVRVAEVATTLVDAADGDQEAASTGLQTVTDRVTYKGLTPGKEYVANLELHRRNADGVDAGVLFDADGKPVTAEQKFFPRASDGEVEVSATFAPADGGGYAVVAFEEIRHRGVLYATHADISDESQTVRVPGIATTATDATTRAHVLNLEGRLNIDDVVAYKGLEVGAAYTVNGALHKRAVDGSDAGVLKDASGKPVTAKVEFKPASTDGTVTLSFEADSRLAAGEAVVAFEELVRDDAGAVVAEHKDIADESQTVHAPKVSTTAVEKSKGAHFARSTSSFTVADTVSYEGLEPGVEYVARGTVRAVEDDGADGGSLPFEGVTRFTPDRPDGEVVVEVEVDPGAAPSKIVLFEEVGIEVDGGVAWVAEHKDLDDEGQAVYIPRITTKAHDRATGERVGVAEAAAVVVDEVSFSGFEKGGAYTIKGTLMDKATGEPFVTDGHEVTAELPFLARSGHGVESIELEIESPLSDGASLVAFERVYDESGDLVAAHEDINFEGQTVNYHSSPSLFGHGGRFDKTGWWFMRYWWVLAFLAAVFLVIGACRRMANDDTSIFNREGANVPRRGEVKGSRGGGRRCR